MPGFIFIGANATRIFEGLTPSATSGTNYTFSGVPFGDAQGNSIFVAVPYLWSTGNDVAFSSVDIDGSAGSAVVSAQGKTSVGTRTARVGLFQQVTTSTSGIVQVNGSASSLGAALSGYRLSNLFSIAADASASAISAADGSPVSPIATTINVFGGSILLLAVCVTDAAPSAVVGASQDGSTTTFPTSTNIGRAWSGSEQSLAAQVGRPLSASTPGPNTSALVSATWH